MTDIEKLEERIKKLEVELEQQKVLLSNSPSMLFMTDGAGKILSFYGPEEELYKPPEEFLGRNVSEMLPPNASEEIMSVIAESSKTGFSRREYSLQIGDETQQYSVRTRRADDNTFTHAINNITKQKKAEEALRQSQVKLSSILNNMTDVVWSISWPDYQHQFLSPSLEKLYGRPAQEFYDNPTLFKEVTHPEDRHLTDKAIIQLQEQGEAVREVRIIRPDGSIIWVNDRSKMIYDENKQPIRVDGMTQDITERKQAEEALRASEAKYRKLYDSSPSWHHTLDLDGRIIRVNKTECYMLGYTHEEMIGKHFYDFVAEREREKAKESYQKKITEKTALKPNERTYITKDGKEVIVNVNDSYSCDNEGKIIGVNTVCQDITERKQHEAGLRALLSITERLARDVPPEEALEHTLSRLRTAGLKIKYVN